MPVFEKRSPHSKKSGCPELQLVELGRGDKNTVIEVNRGSVFKMPNLGPMGRGGARRRTRRRQQAMHGAAAQPASPTATPENSEQEYLHEIEKLAKLRDQGIISEEEFASKKAQLLGL